MYIYKFISDKILYKIKKQKIINKSYLAAANLDATQPFQAALGAKSRVCFPGNTADRQL
jgi:hypothetical protein